MHKQMREQTSGQMAFVANKGLWCIFWGDIGRFISENRYRFRLYK